ncbi:TRAP transporter large permease [Metabacillus litoralis]|uniref:TRAP transporter large permease n=1 Tax=Metabacillus litoralis TaxID=152268 RepID=UPI00203F1A28|nr:TRAP transporter large permease [Metabacillus litoralis]MCM3160776.1 TRAP transporter large permease [Metabacillus litoralis]
MAVITIVLLLIFMALSLPIALSIGLASTIGIINDGSIPLFIIIQRVFNTLDSFPLMAIPFFILAGSIMERGGLSKRLIAFADSLIGHKTGGLGMVLVMTSMFFAAISGSSAATVAAVGSIMIPAMVNKGYDRSFAGATAAVSGELGMIIPPSVAMIIFGIVTGVSIGDMFIAGIIPGIMIGLSLMLLVYFISKKKGYKGSEKSTWSQRFTAFKKAIWALIMPFIILGGIYSGIFTPTEAAVIAVVYAFIVGTLIYKEIRLSDIIPLLRDSFVTSAIVMIIIGLSGIFNWILTKERFGLMVSEYFQSLTDNVIIFLLVVNLILFIVGMFFENGAAIVILAPILTPIAIEFGVDPVHFGIIMIVNLAMGMVTPPLGVNLFVACQIGELRIDQIIRPLVPFLIVIIVNVFLLSYIPGLALGVLEIFN